MNFQFRSTAIFERLPPGSSLTMSSIRTKIDEMAGLGVIIKSLMNLRFNEVLSSLGAE